MRHDTPNHGSSTPFFIYYCHAALFISHGVNSGSHSPRDLCVWKSEPETGASVYLGENLGNVYCRVFISLLIPPISTGEAGSLAMFKFYGHIRSNSLRARTASLSNCFVRIHASLCVSVPIPDRRATGVFLSHSQPSKTDFGALKRYQIAWLLSRPRRTSNRSFPKPTVPNQGTSLSFSPT